MLLHIITTKGWSYCYFRDLSKLDWHGYMAWYFDNVVFPPLQRFSLSPWFCSSNLAVPEFRTNFCTYVLNVLYLLFARMFLKAEAMEWNFGSLTVVQLKSKIPNKVVSINQHLNTKLNLWKFLSDKFTYLSEDMFTSKLFSYLYSNSRWRST